MSKKKKIDKTLVEKILDKHQIPYEPVRLPWKEEHHIAQIQIDESGIDPHFVFKTLVLSSPSGPLVAVIPIESHLDMKKLAKLSGNKRVEMLPLKDLMKTTGYEHGANTPIGIHEKHDYPIYFDPTALALGSIVVSSGKVGHSVKIDAQQLIDFVDGKIGNILE